MRADERQSVRMSKITDDSLAQNAL